MIKNLFQLDRELIVKNKSRLVISFLKLKVREVQAEEVVKNF